MNTQAFDIAIRRARLRGSAVRNADIGITDGRIAAIASRLEGSAATEIDARGNLPAMNDMPAARTEMKLTPGQVKQVTEDLISDRDRTEAMASGVQPR